MYSDDPMSSRTVPSSNPTRPSITSGTTPGGVSAGKMAILVEMANRYGGEALFADTAKERAVYAKMEAAVDRKIIAEAERILRGKKIT